MEINRLPLLKQVFKWSREINPSQPVTCGVWNDNLKELNAFQVKNSDIITYHNYSDEANHQKMIDSLKLYNRPLVCTEYMARRNNSLFSTYNADSEGTKYRCDQLGTRFRKDQYYLCVGYSNA